jgi:hypothetical protein
MRLLVRLLAFLALVSPAAAQTDSYLASNGTFKTPFALANTWTAVQTFNVAPVFGVLPSLPLAQNQILQGNVSAVATPVTFSAAIDAAIGSTRGSILERGASGWQIVAPGTTALPLVSNGSGADPAYQVLTNAGLANMAAGTIKGNSTGITGPATDLNGAQAEGVLLFTQSGTGAVQRFVDAKLKESVTPEDFGAAGNGVTNDTTALQNAINQALATNSPLLLRNNYLINAALTHTGSGTLNIRGTGRYSSSIIMSTATSDLFQKSGTGNIVVRDIALTTNINKTAGSVFNLTGNGAADTIDNCWIYGPSAAVALFNGITSQTEVIPNISRNYFLNISANSMSLANTQGATFGAEAAIAFNTVDTVIAHGGGSVGVQWASGAGTEIFVGNRFQNTDYGILVQPNLNGVTTLAFNITGNEFAANQVGGVVFSLPGGNTSVVSDATITGNRFNEPTGVAILLTGAVQWINQTTISGNSFVYAAANTINLNAGASVHVNGNTFNSTGGNIAAITTQAAWPQQVTVGVNTFLNTTTPYSFNANPNIFGAWKAFTPAISCGTATFTVNQAQVNYNGIGSATKTSNLVLDFTITAIGTCTNTLNFTIPNSTSGASVLFGQESAGTNGNMAGCHTAAATSTMGCFKLNNANYAVNERWIISGLYQSQ